MMPLRRIRLLAGLLVGLVVLAAGGGFLWLRSSLPDLQGEKSVVGLGDRVEIIRDSNAIPHIFAKTTADAYFALGYAHAQDRLWQMEFMRRVGAGRLAEILGEKAVGADRYIRTLGIPRVAAAISVRMPAEGKVILSAYAKGVNAWLANRSGALPPEFVLLQIDPEPWKPADSILWSRLMAMRLGRNNRTELIRVQVARALADKGLPATLLDELWPQPASHGPVTIPDAVRKAAALFDTLPGAKGLDLPADSGSNGWVLHGTRTITGKPILANDPHLRFGAPIMWYLARMEAPGLSLTGATVPGVPFMLLGHNGAIAWGMTSADADVEDHFVETLDPEKPGHYLAPIGSSPFVTRSETIRVKDADDVVMTVRTTRHGPVISDLSADTADGQVIALSTTALDVNDGTATALMGINKARDWEQFRDAALGFKSPSTNLFFAATNGDIGFYSAGLIPIRKSGDGRVPASSPDGSQDWIGYVPAIEQPMLYNPPSGSIVNANNRTVGDRYEWLLTRDWNQPFRAERIRETLDGESRHDLAASMALQQDTLSTAARLLLPLMLTGTPQSDRHQQALSILASWDFNMRRDRPAPAIYAAWLRRLGQTIIADEISGPLVERYQRLINSPNPRLIELVLTGQQHWCDNVTTTGATETCGDQLSLSLDQALNDLTEYLGDDMASWRWGALHRATFTHRILTNIPILKGLADRDIPSDGGLHTVNRGGYSAGETPAPFSQLDGSGYRAVYDLSNLGNSRFMIATGQSGNFLSDHYDDLLRRWRDGEYITIAGSREDVARTADNILTLTPETGNQSR